MSEFKHEEDVLRVIEAYLCGNSARRQMALGALGEMAEVGSERALRMLMEISDSNDDPDAAEVAQEIIAHLRRLRPHIFEKVDEGSLLVVGSYVLGPRDLEEDYNFWLSLLTDDRPEVWTEAAFRLLRSGDAEKVDAAIQALKREIEKYGGVFGYPVKTLERKLYDGEIDVGVLERLLMSIPIGNDRNTVWFMAEMAKTFGLERVMERLRKSPETSAKIALINLCESPLSEEERAMLIESLFSTTKEVAACAADQLLALCEAETLAGIADQIIAALLWKVESRSRFDMLNGVKALILAAKLIPADEARVKMEESAGSRSALGRVKAVAFAAAIGDLDWLSKLANDVHPEVRRAVVVAIATMSVQDPEARKILFGLVPDEDSGVREMAIETLIKSKELFYAEANALKCFRY